MHCTGASRGQKHLSGINRVRMCFVSVTVSDIAREFTRRRRSLWQTQSGSLEGHQLKREPEQRPAQVVGGAPHGFGVWMMGGFHRVDIGALGTAIVKLTGELEAARKELVEQRQATQSPQQT